MSTDTASSVDAMQTALGDMHVAMGGRMVEFAGYSLPVSYTPGIVEEHLWTRQSASLFDVSHMGQIAVRGENAAAALESLIPLNLIDMPPGRQRYSVLTNDHGGIIDDLMAARLDDYFVLVVNAACKTTDFEYLNDRIGSQVKLQMLDDRSLIAVQGPLAAHALIRIQPLLSQMRFMDVAEVPMLGTKVLVSRSGYTGEDGFEISVNSLMCEPLAAALLAEEEIRLAGLGARDLLRLEAGLCLYGQDIDETTTPVEAAIEFAVSAARRPGGARAGGFPGYEQIAEQFINGARRRRRGLTVDSRVPVRTGTQLYSAQDEHVGTVTSGGFGPTAGTPIAMAYIDEAAKSHSTLTARVRSRSIDVSISPIPAVPHRYYKPQPAQPRTRHESA